MSDGNGPGLEDYSNAHMRSRSDVPRVPINGPGVPLTDEEAMLRSGDVSVRIQERLRVTVTPQMHEAIRAHHVAEAEKARLRALIKSLNVSLHEADTAMLAAEHAAVATAAKLADAAKVEKL